VPNSADKGKSFFDQRDENENLKGDKRKLESEFYLSYRDQRQKDNFLGFYRMKSLLFAVSHLTAEDLRCFKIMGTMEKKVIIAFHEKLKIFCFFDQHAMHERIRYEYYLECLSGYDNKDLQRREWNKSIIEKSGKEMNVISSIKHSYISFRVSQDFD
jgi:DNA mismatch repair ATPase MutL